MQDRLGSRRLARVQPPAPTSFYSGRMRRFLVVPALLVPLSAAAGGAEHESDVDGDGKPDLVRIEAPGQIVVERGGGGGQVIPLGLSGELREATLTIAGPGRPFVVATAHIGDGWEGLALRWDAGGLREVWRGPVGPAGDDGEYEVWIAATAGGLVRWQQRADLTRCDGGPVELFREGWDPRARRFRPIRPGVRIPDKLPVVKATAERGAAGAAAAGWYRVRLGSTQAGADDAGELVAPRALGDGDPATAWREDRGGDGTGELFDVRPATRGGRAAAVRIVPGDGQSAAALAAGNRVARLAVLGKTGSVLIDVPDPVAGGGPGQAYLATLPAPIDGCVTIVIVDVHRGARARAGTGDTAIAELAVLADVELAPGGAEPLLAAQVAQGGVAGDSAARALATRGAAAVAALTAELGRATGVVRPRLLGALAQLREPGVVAPLAEGLARGELTERRRDDAAARLAELPPAGPAALAALVAQADADEAGRLAAARALARIDPTAIAGAAGTGSRSFRAAVVALLAPAGAAALVARVPSATTPAARADLWRAAGKAALRADDGARPAVAAMLTALAGEADYQVRYRLVAAIAPVGDATELATLAGWLERVGDDARGRALRRVGAQGLGHNPVPAARAALTGLAGDRDPGTRLAAVTALALEPRTAAPPPGGRPAAAADEPAARAGADRALATVLAGDSWPELRRGAASALGLACQRTGPRTALETATGRDPDVDVRIDALTALVSCRAPGIADRLLQVADDGKAPLPLRDRAIALYAGLPGEVGAVLTRFERWRGQAFSDATALRLAVRAAGALGELGDRRAAAPLFDAAQDAAFPELQAAAVTALGMLGPQCPKQAVPLLRSLAQSEERGVALAARGAIGRCGT